jgi:hypothetical protein
LGSGRHAKLVERRERYIQRQPYGLAEIIYDNNSGDETDWDLANTAWYSSYTLHVDTARRLDYASGYIDQGPWAGGTAVRDYDQLNEHNFANPRTGQYDDWQYVEVVYDKYGTPMAKEIKWDAGNITDVYYDPYNEHTDWNSYTNSYDPSGQFVGRTVVDDYGRLTDGLGGSGLWVIGILSVTIFF